MAMVTLDVQRIGLQVYFFKRMGFAALGLLVFASCAPVQSEKLSTIVVDGRSYELRMQVVDGRNGVFQRTSVVVNNTAYACLADSPGDCEAAVRDAKSHSAGD